MKEGKVYRLLPEASAFARYVRDRYGYLWLCVDASRARFKSVATGMEHTFYPSEMEKEE
jgi:hypothetical protein